MDGSAVHQSTFTFDRSFNFDVVVSGHGTKVLCNNWSQSSSGSERLAVPGQEEEYESRLDDELVGIPLKETAFDVMLEEFDQDAEEAASKEPVPKEPEA